MYVSIVSMYILGYILKTKVVIMEDKLIMIL